MFPGEFHFLLKHLSPKQNDKEVLNKVNHMQTIFSEFHCALTTSQEHNIFRKIYDLERRGSCV